MKSQEICIVIFCAIAIAFFTIHHVRESILQRKFIDSLEEGDILESRDPSYSSLEIIDKRPSGMIRVRKYGLVYIVYPNELNHKAYKKKMKLDKSYKKNG